MEDKPNNLIPEIQLSLRGLPRSKKDQFKTAQNSDFGALLYPICTSKSQVTDYQHQSLSVSGSSRSIRYKESYTPFWRILDVGGNPMPAQL
ncbi:MAG: hypothetical protein ACO2XQ_09320 [Flavobacteriales bacterium]